MSTNTVTLKRCRACGALWSMDAEAFIVPGNERCKCRPNNFEPVLYAPVNDEREAAVREMREALAKVVGANVPHGDDLRLLIRMVGGATKAADSAMTLADGLDAAKDEARAAIARFDRAEGRVG